MTADIFDFDKVKKKKQQEETEFTYKGYVEDLKYIQSQWNLLDYEQQTIVFMQTSDLLASLIESAIEKGLE